VKRAISLVLVPEIAAAAILAGCGADQRTAQRCVDERLVVVHDENCEEQARRIRTGVGVSWGRYYWYHGGRGTTIGTPASGGSAIYAHPSVPRGGFGAMGAMRSGGT
jgi:hypothetical protein